MCCVPTAIDHGSRQSFYNSIAIIKNIQLLLPTTPTRFNMEIPGMLL